MNLAKQGRRNNRNRNKSYNTWTYSKRWKSNCFDRVLASRMGDRAVEVLVEGKSSRVIGIRDGKII